MSIAEKAFDIVVKNIDKIAGGAAVAAVGAGVGYAAKAVVDDRKFQQRAGEVYELGVKKGVKLGSAEARRVFVDPLLARVAVSQYIALADGKVSRAEQKLIDSILSAVNANPNFPKSAIKEIEKITSAETLAFETVAKYLAKLDATTLAGLAEDINEIACATKGVSYKEQAAIDEFDRYLLAHMDTEQKKISAKRTTEVLPPSVPSKEESLDDYFSNFVPQETIEEAKTEFSLRMRFLDMTFKRKTKLNEQEIALLTVAVGLQCLRIYLVNKVTGIEKANHGEKEDFLHKQQQKLLGAFDKGNPEKARPYYAPLNEIISTQGVPYDTTAYAEKKLGLFKGKDGAKGVNHRFATPGHDPIIGLVIGTTNIMTNTITTTPGNGLVLATNHVVYDNAFRHPKIAGTASLATAVSKVVERSKEDLTPLVAAFIKQLIHIATDIYTPAGIQLPGANLVMDRVLVEQLTKYVSSGDVVKIGASAAVADLINKIIELLHGCMLIERGSPLDDQLNKVKTKKIVLYSNAIATSSSVISEYVLGQFDKIDLGGLLTLMKRVFTDIEFIYDVKYEFLKSGLEDLLK